MSIRDELNLVLIRIPTQSITHSTSLKVDRDGRKVERWHQQASVSSFRMLAAGRCHLSLLRPQSQFRFNSFIWVITWRSQGSLFVHQSQQEMLKCDSLDFLTFTTAGQYHDNHTRLSETRSYRSTQNGTPRPWFSPCTGSNSLLMIWVLVLQGKWLPDRSWK